MKWAFYVLVVLYMFYRAVYGAKAKEGTLELEPLNYDADQHYLKAGLSKRIVCKGSTKTQKVEWYDPAGHIVKHHPKGRIHVQESYLPSFRTAIRSQVLFINHATVADSGLWECRSGNLRQNISLCVIEPVIFLDTKTVVTVDAGRSITLSCQARGDPEPTIIWSRNGEYLNLTNDELSTKYKMMTSYKSQGIERLLTVTSLDPYDMGTYECIAIQENLLAEDCSNTESLNITLNVNFSPVFRTDNGSTYNFYTRNNESIELVCEARGFPIPTYRWFHEKGEVLSELSENQIKISDDGTKSMLPLLAGPSTFNEKYKCKATNPYGDAYMTFKVVKLEKPGQPLEISVANYTDSEIEFLILWDEEKPYYPEDSVEIQYMKKKKTFGTPREFHWRTAKKVEIFEDDPQKITGLDEETEYWVRLRWKNKAGDSGWSAPVLVSTGAKLEEPEEQERTKDENFAEPEVGSSGIFYGLFIAGAVVIFSVGCMFLIKLV